MEMLTPCCAVRLGQRDLLDLIGFQFFKGIDIPQEIRCGNLPERLRESYYQHHQGMIHKRSRSNISTGEAKKGHRSVP